MQEHRALPDGLAGVVWVSAGATHQIATIGVGAVSSQIVTRREIGLEGRRWAGLTSDVIGRALAKHSVSHGQVRGRA